MASVVSEYLWHAKEFDWVGKKRKGSWYKCYYHRLLILTAQILLGKTYLEIGHFFFITCEGWPALFFQQGEGPVVP